MDALATMRWQVFHHYWIVKVTKDTVEECRDEAKAFHMPGKRSSTGPARRGALAAALLLIASIAPLPASARSGPARGDSGTVKISISVVSRYSMRAVAGPNAHSERPCLVTNSPEPAMPATLVWSSAFRPEVREAGSRVDVQLAAGMATAILRCGPMDDKSALRTFNFEHRPANQVLLVRPE